MARDHRPGEAFSRARRPTPSCGSSSRRNWTRISPPGCCRTPATCRGWPPNISACSTAARSTPTTRRVQVSAGRITAYLRDEWGLNAILADGDDDEKNREDHRHHAVDAVVIALTDAAHRRTAEPFRRAGRGARAPAVRADEIEKPWPTFLDDVRRSIDAINISYRVNRRVTGALHEETNYSKPHKMQRRERQGTEYRHVRKPLQNMSANEVENIVDDTIRALVQGEVGIKSAASRKRLFADPATIRI